jgi:hypothetical protein
VGFQLILSTIVLNQDGQVCVKTEGTTGILAYIPEMARRGATIAFNEIEWGSPPLSEYYPDISPTKGTISSIDISFVTVSESSVDDGSSASDMEKMAKRANENAIDYKRRAQEHVKSFAANKLLPFFTNGGRSVSVDSALYLRLVYPISMDNVGIYNAYLSYMINVKSPEITIPRICNLFQCALARIPEIPDASTWMEIIDIRFAFEDEIGDLKSADGVEKLKIATGKMMSTKMEKLLDSVDGDFRCLFIKAICVAINLLTVYSIAVPYLSDLEHIPDAAYALPEMHRVKAFGERWNVQQSNRYNDDGHGTNSTLPPSSTAPIFSKNRMGPSRDPRSLPKNKRGRESSRPNLIPVERFFSPTSSFGYDCEEASTFAVKLKCEIQRKFYRMQMTMDKTKKNSFVDPLVARLGRVYELFNACVMGVYTRTGGEEVFHIACFLIPRWFLYEAKMRGKKNHDRHWLTESISKSSSLRSWGPLAPVGAKKWEKTNYYGSFVAEGTCLEEPCKFDGGDIFDERRTRFSKNRDLVIRAIRFAGLDEKQFGLINRIRFEHKEDSTKRGTKSKSFYLITNTFDHIDDGDNLKKMPSWNDTRVSANVYESPEKTSYVWYDASLSNITPGNSSRPYGLSCQKLFSRSDSSGCYPISAFATREGRLAFECSMTQMNQDWPPMNPPSRAFETNTFESPQKKSDWPRHIIDLDDLLRKVFDGKISFDANIDDGGKCLILHIPDNDSQCSRFRKSVASAARAISKSSSSDYYAIRLDVKYIQNTAYYPALEEYDPSNRFKDDYDVSVETRPLYQILLILYYKS